MIKVKKDNSCGCKIFEGNVQSILDHGFCREDEYSVVETSIAEQEDIKSPEDCLKVISKWNIKNLVVVIKDPYRSDRDLDWEFDHVVVGPLFAALLLKEYDTARKLLAKNPRPLIKGRVVNVCDDGTLFTGEDIYMGQLFLVDPDIPDDLVADIHEMIVRYYGYDLNTDLFENKYLQMTDPMQKSENYFWGDEREAEPYFARKLQTLRRNYPIVFDCLFDMLTGGNISADFFGNYLNDSDRSMIMRMVCKYRSDDHKSMLFWFEEETKELFSDCFAAFLFCGVSKSYLTDVKAVYKYLKDDKEYYPRFVKAVTMMAIRFGDEQLAKIAQRAICGKGPVKFTIEDLALNLWGDGMTDPEISPLYAEIKNNFSSDDYIDYMIKFMKMYKRCTKKKICLLPDSQIMKNYYSTVRSKDTMLMWADYEDPFQPAQYVDVESFREKIKGFLGLVDSVERENDPFRMSTYDMPLLRIADEELIVQNFEKGLLLGEKADEYIKELIKTERTSLVPAVTAFA